MKIALAQLDIEHGDVKGNVERAIEAIDDAAGRDADIVCLPEIFNVGYFAFEAYERAAEGLSGPTLSRLSEAAAESGINVLSGTIVEDLAETSDVATPADEGLANTAVLFDRAGERRAVYRKHHLFGYESAEAELLVPGEDPLSGVCEIEGFTVGITTCYDLRFPELYRELVEEGVSLVLVPSAWPYPRVEHWTTLSRARAIENQCYVATVNGSAEYEGTRLLGRSTVFDPWGTTLASAADDPTLVTSEIDPGRVERVREEFPALGDRRS
ncbi:carbon-nitrogen family hydrolase [Halalkalicoccus jeotgali]|uniref:Nitrilase n=1 Tax=Halalkalicoccus jeotgali (strain DSM 18796 / CECT 7217 / JCM 14584 / KCTC 4019 / B3) TaxID=795797 RepID=D8J5G3_HALJB|nr:carbon-nitrogen family hydrolase [Halalkalicoccus jeotgali]ADJ15659.1 nitrilase [Halalkalicoccus jeotgali B3]ELY36571.1 nitrilase [Halalkalicoccus jeotgali B3]